MKRGGGGGKPRCEEMDLDKVCDWAQRRRTSGWVGAGNTEKHGSWWMYEFELDKVAGRVPLHLFFLIYVTLDCKCLH